MERKRFVVTPAAFAPPLPSGTISLREASSPTGSSLFPHARWLDKAARMHAIRFDPYDTFMPPRTELIN